MSLDEDRRLGKDSVQGSYEALVLDAENKRQLITEYMYRSVLQAYIAYLYVGIGKTVAVSNKLSSFLREVQGGCFYFGNRGQSQDD